jgi:hypothetical protein
VYYFNNTPRRFSMKLFSLLITLAPLSLLVACGSSEDDGTRGTDISVDAKTEDGSSVAIRADGATGKVSVNAPGFDANVSLPKVMLDNGDFDIDGVKLYPGSKVAAVNVNANTSGTAKKSTVQISFAAPADIELVRAWFAKSFTEKSVAATATPAGFEGKTSDNGSFTLTLTPDGAGGTKGTVTILDDEGWSGAPAQPAAPKPPAPPPVP